MKWVQERDKVIATTEPATAAAPRISLRPLSGIIYAEWVYTVRNWKQLALSYLLALIFALQAMVGERYDGTSTFFNLPIFFLLFLSAQRAAARLNEDFHRGAGVIYLRTGIRPSLVLAAKWLVESGLNLLLLGFLLVLLAYGGTVVGAVGIFHLVASASALTAVVVALTVIFPRVSRIGMPLIIFSSLPLLALSEVFPPLRVAAYLLPWLGALSGLDTLSQGDPIPFALPVAMMSEAIFLLVFAGWRYQKELLARL